MSTEDSNVPYGYCHCGCGLKANIAPRNDRKRGFVKGKPYKYLASHNPGKKGLEASTYRVVDTGHDTPCWLWLGKLGNHGYPQLSRDGKVQTGHRYSYRFYKGEIPQGHQVHHTCEIKRCVNPEHLKAVTPTEHIRGMPGTKLTFEDAEQIRRLNREGLGQHKLGIMFGVSHTTIASIVHYKSWRNSS